MLSDVGCTFSTDVSNLHLSRSANWVLADLRDGDKLEVTYRGCHASSAKVTSQRKTLKSETLPVSLDTFEELISAYPMVIQWGEAGYVITDTGRAYLEKAGYSTGC